MNRLIFPLKGVSEDINTLLKSILLIAHR